MKRFSALARSIAFGFAVVALSVSTQAASYRWTLLEVEQTDPKDPLSGLHAMDNPKAFSLMVSAGVIKIAHSITIECGPDGVGSVDQTYGLRYPQSLDALDRPHEFTTRRVGIQATVKELPQNAVEFHLVTTELEGWIAFTSRPSFNALQPIFVSNESTSTITLDKYGPMIVGSSGVTEKILSKGKAPTSKKIARIYVLEKLPPTDAAKSTKIPQPTIPTQPHIQQPTTVTPPAKESSETSTLRPTP